MLHYVSGQKQLSTMTKLQHCAIFYAVLSLFTSDFIQAYSPFGGSFPRRKCLKGRRIIGCNETFLDAYKRTEMSKSDPDGNEPKTYFMLFTRKNKNKPEYLDQCGTRLPVNTFYNCKADTVYVIHGLVEGVCDIAWMREMKDQLLYRDDYNVILTDWTWGNFIDYMSASGNVETVGHQIAFMINNIMEEKCVSPRRFHIIGHSLGGHIGGVAGRTLKHLTGTKIRRITSLDPTALGFDHSKNCLKKSDAILVDAIHSSASRCIPFGLGLIDTVGHADFYPNGGFEQPGCISYAVQSLLKGDLLYAISSLGLPVCSHRHSIQYFKESINACDCQFVGVECDNYDDFQSGKCRSCGHDGCRCAVMGMDWEFFPKCDKKNHSYYLETDTSCPYCDNSGIRFEGFSASLPGINPKCFEP